MAPGQVDVAFALLDLQRVRAEGERLQADRERLDEVGSLGGGVREGEHRGEQRRRDVRVAPVEPVVRVDTLALLSEREGSARPAHLARAKEHLPALAAMLLKCIFLEDLARRES